MIVYGRVAAGQWRSYKQIRPTVQDGALYRLRSPLDSDADEYIGQDDRQFVLFAHFHSQHFGRNVPLLRLQGLDLNATYRVRTTDDALKGIETITGALEHRGLQLGLRGDYDNMIITFDRIQ